MDAHDWDERYRGRDLVWSPTPNQFVAAELADVPPGRALDLAAGEGRNAVWLAERGWTVTAIDFSKVAVTKGHQMATARGVDLTWVRADVLAHPLQGGGYDLVLLSYLQLPREQQRAVHARAAAAVTPGGTLLVIGHDRSNLEYGYGGPSDPGVLLTRDDVAADLAGTGLTVVRAEVVTREVETDAGRQIAFDTLVRAERR